jgi:hypothetical protein
MRKRILMISITYQTVVLEQLENFQQLKVLRAVPRWRKVRCTVCAMLPRWLTAAAGCGMRVKAVQLCGFCSVWCAEPAGGVGSASEKRVGGAKASAKCS